ncbi:TDP-N-acetylfucosamine:lipid II N-acetylfucosaminyltransferase [Lacinutrix neustonica]|uniref:TDP-N-acetylfucosamine:lipid II N-acetylfucosaminyltransferase n=1 Tax=Lacinutrix neustonica TaxID=2980107 RepID=A0A9E8MUR1_9FLAO|nr:TDP-N-acetylfucosamine:lipid II N-acetylfucosaminyltransferase [Lacinutrix neustonica]WAC01927.1 TDP-N-acetylfucosamine:lipid II N-acetylfucosaminyltransferase [Lacinutrix neustonica]
MNYHIMAQDKFIDSYIEDIYSVEENDNNVFLIRGEPNETNYINTNKEVVYLGYDHRKITHELNKINQNDTIIVHWYDYKIAEILAHYTNTLIVYLRGGEFYEYPFWEHAKRNYDKKTYARVKKELYPKINFDNGLKKFIKTLKKRVRQKNHTKKEYQRRLIQMGRIDYIICGELNVVEISLLRRLYPSLKAKHIAGFYNLNFNLTSTLTKKKTDNDRFKILIGNSATPSNNHLEAFEKVKHIKNVNVYCFLSYGQEWYKKEIIKSGLKLFGENFIPITEYMDRARFVEFIANMDVVYMYHNRSQAWGNIATALALGKPVFLKRNNPIKEYINAIGIATYNANDILAFNLNTLINEEQLKMYNNRDKLEHVISDELRLNHLKKLLSTYAS